MKTIILDNSLIFKGNLILVNFDHPYIQQNIALENMTDNPNDILMQKAAATALKSCFEFINAFDDITLVSGWRSKSTQENIFFDCLKKNGEEFTKKYVAAPNHSEHQTGLAIDLALKSDNIDFICPDFPYSGICEKFRTVSKDFGFIERYPKSKEHLTKIAHEPWHFRYVGTPYSQIITQYNFTLEEFINFVKQFPYNNNHFIYENQENKFLISYLKASNLSSTSFEIFEDIQFAAAGNNIDGFIITQWR